MAETSDDSSSTHHISLWYFVIAFLCITLTQLVHAVILPRALQLWLPEASLVMLVGLVAGAIIAAVNHELLVEAVTFKPWVFFHVLLPPIIFYAGYSLEKNHGHVFFANIGTVTLLAVVGTAASAAITAGFMELVMQTSPASVKRWTTAECFLFGTLVGATDPVATLSVFKSVGADDTIYNLVFGESVLNDAAAIVLFRVIVPFADANDANGTSDARAVGNAIGMLVGASAGSLGIGLAGGFVVSLMLKLIARSRRGVEGTNEAVHDEVADVPTLLVYVVGFMLYGAAEAAKFSGIVALVTYSVVVGHYAYWNMSTSQRRVSIEFSRVVGSLFELFVFAYIGVAASASVPKNAWSGELIFSAIPITMLARAGALVPIFFLANRFRRRKIPAKAQLLCVAAGLRGAVAFALAISADSPNSDSIVATTLGVVVFTTLVLGGTTAPLANWLGIGAGTNQPKALFDTTTPREEEAAAAATSHGDATAAPQQKTSKMWFLRLDRNVLRPFFCTREAVEEMAANERAIAEDPKRLAEIAGEIASNSAHDGYHHSSELASSSNDLDGAVVRRKSGGSRGGVELITNPTADPEDHA